MRVDKATRCEEMRASAFLALLHLNLRTPECTCICTNMSDTSVHAGYVSVKT